MNNVQISFKFFFQCLCFAQCSIRLCEHSLIQFYLVFKSLFCVPITLVFISTESLKIYFRMMQCCAHLVLVILIISLLTRAFSVPSKYFFLRSHLFGLYLNHLFPINALLSVLISYFIKTFNAPQKLMSFANLL